MRILIIGGTGLISTPITGYLVERGDDVTLYNRGMSVADIPASSKKITGDRKDYAAFERQMAEAGTFDCVIDMYAFIPEDMVSAIRAFRGRVGHMVFCSTCSVYAMPPSRYPIAEGEMRTVSPGYGGNKTRCEDLLFEAGERGDFAVTSIRPYDAYGGKTGLAHTFGRRTSYIDRIRKGKPIVVNGDGHACHVSCHVDDVARVFVGAICNPKAYGKAYNVTGDEYRSWNDYHRGVAQALGVPGPTLVHIPTDLLDRVAPKRAGSADRYNYYYDLSAAKADLGFCCTMSWAEGVRRTVEWLDSRGLVENSDLDPFEDRLIAAWERMGAGMVQEFAGLDG